MHLVAEKFKEEKRLRGEEKSVMHVVVNCNGIYCCGCSGICIGNTGDSYGR